MSTLLLLAAGPLQAWGVRSASPRRRDTLRFPSRSGVIGLLAACRGELRTDPLDWASDLVITVRVDQPGRVITDFHTAGGGYEAREQMRSGTGKPRADAEVSTREYLADAAFVVAVTGPEALVRELASSVRKPAFTPFLGRKACPPGLPLFLGVSDTDDPLEVLGTLPAYGEDQRSGFEEVGFDDLASGSGALTVWVENPEFASTVVNDVPVTFDHWRREYRPRPVGEQVVHVSRGGVALDGVAAMRSALTDREAS